MRRSFSDMARFRSPVASARAASQWRPSSEQAEDGLDRQLVHLLDEVVLQRQPPRAGQRQAGDVLEPLHLGAHHQVAEEVARHPERQHRGPPERAAQELVVRDGGAGGHPPRQPERARVEPLVVAELPVGVAGAGLVEGGDVLPGHVVVVRHGVGGQVGQEAPREGLLLAGARLVEHGEADLPVVGVVDEAGQVLADHDVGGQRAVEELVAEVGQQVAERPGQRTGGGQRLGREGEVGQRAPRQRVGGPCQDEERRDGEAGRDGTTGHGRGHRGDPRVARGPTAMATLG